MPAQRYSQYFNIDEKYYAVVTKDLIDKGLVKWDGFYPHETFVQLLRQTVDMLSGKENKSIWVEGTYGTGKSHASLALKCLLQAPDNEVRAYFNDYGLSDDLCNKFLAARSESINGKLIVVHRIGSANIRNDNDLIWAIQNSISVALEDAGVSDQAAGTMKSALVDWVNEKAANKTYLNSLLEENPMDFDGKNIDQLLSILNSDDETSIEYIMGKLVSLCRDNGILCLNLDAEKLASWIEKVIEKNKLGAIVFIWDEFSEYFKNCQNALTGFQTLVEISESSPFYFIIVTHESDSLIANASDRSKISNRFIEPRVHIELPDNMAFMLMHKAMKETDDPIMKQEWSQVKAGLNARLGTVRSTITASAQKHAKTGSKTILSDSDLQDIVPLHPYAALILKHISRVFTASQRSMFDFIVARDPDEGNNGKQNDDSIACRAFKWYINHHNAKGDNLMTVDMLWDFFNAKAGGNMNPDALEILNNFDTLSSEFHLDADQQRVLKTILLMNAICTRVQEADMLVPTYDNIELAFLGTGWPKGKATNIAKALVHRDPPLQPVLFEEPMENGAMRVIPKATGGVDIEDIKQRLRTQISTQTLVEAAKFDQVLSIPANLKGHFVTQFIYTNVRSSQTYTTGYKELVQKAQNDSNRFYVGIVLAMSDDERAASARHIQDSIKGGLPENVLLIDGTTNTFASFWDSYITNRAYSEYYIKPDPKQSAQFASFAQKNLSNWCELVQNGQFRLYDSNHPNGQMRATYSTLMDLLQEVNKTKYPYGVEQFKVLPQLFTRMSMGQGAEYGINEVEKGAFSTGNTNNRLSTALDGAWKVPGEYWKDPAKQSLPIVKIKQEVERVIADGFKKNGRVEIIEILNALSVPPYGFVASNLTAFVMGFVLKEYAVEKYSWSNGNTYPMTAELLKGAIKNALDQSVSPKANYRNEAIVTMSESMRLFLAQTAAIFHESPEHCGSVDAAAGVIRLGMKRLEFPIWCLKAILDTESLKSDAAVVSRVIDMYLGIANIKNYAQQVTESDIAKEIGDLMKTTPEIIEDLKALFTSQKCRDGMKAYLVGYQNSELIALATTINDEGAYISEVKKKFNADEANWVWSTDTANSKIDEVITEYKIVSESNTIIAPAVSFAGCLRNWKDRVQNFRISYEAMENEVGPLKILLGILYELRKSTSAIPADLDKNLFLEQLVQNKANFIQLYSHQIDMFKKISASWLTEIDEDDVETLFTEHMDTGVFADPSDKFFKSVEEKVGQFLKAKVKARLEELWHDKTGTKSPREWSSVFSTPILCMFDESERQTAKDMFEVFLKQNPNKAEANTVMDYLNSATFYDRLASEDERNRCMKERVIGDYALMLPDVDEVRNYLRSYLSMIHPYEWMDNSTIRNRIEQMADKSYKTSGAAKAQIAIDNLGEADTRAYLKDLIKSNMSVGIAILKKNQN